MLKSFCIYIFMLLFLISSKAYAQKQFGQDNFSINPYVGIIPNDYAAKLNPIDIPKGADFIGSPVLLGLKGEFIGGLFWSIKVDVNWIKIGYHQLTSTENTHWNPETGEYHTSTSYRDYEKTTRKFRVMLGMNFYFSRAKRVHTYSTIQVGYRNVLRRQVENKVVSTPVIFAELGDYGFPIAGRVGLGQKWFISEQFSITTELGLGGTPIQIGVDVNF